jgi:hypothetical protein
MLLAVRLNRPDVGVFYVEVCGSNAFSIKEVLAAECTANLTINCRGPVARRDDDRLTAKPATHTLQKRRQLSGHINLMLMLKTPRLLTERKFAQRDVWRQPGTKW